MSPITLPASLAIAGALACQPVATQRTAGDDDAARRDTSRDAKPIPPGGTWDPGPAPSCKMALGRRHAERRPSHCANLGLGAHPPEAQLDACARRLFTGFPGGWPERLEWRLAVSSRLLPGLRVYHATNRYPKALSVDLVDGAAIEKIDLPLINKRLHDRGVIADSPAEVHDLAVFAVLAENEPYVAENLTVELHRERDTTIAEARFERTTVWSPPDNIMVAGAKVAEYMTTLAFAPDGCIEHLGTAEVRVIETRP